MGLRYNYFEGSNDKMMKVWMWKMQEMGMKGRPHH